VRKFLVPAVLAVALVLPGQAAAKSIHYTGTVSPSGTIGFNVVKKKKKKGKKKPKPTLNGFSFAGVPVNCDEGPKTAHGFVSFPVKLVGGSFNIVAQSSTGANLAIHGNLATGTIELSGNVAIEPSGTGTNCQSGVLSWTAQRG
jgi:hypothetical protein